MFPCINKTADATIVLHITRVANDFDFCAGFYVLTVLEHTWWHNGLETIRFVYIILYFYNSKSDQMFSITLFGVSLFIVIKDASLNWIPFCRMQIY